MNASASNFYLTHTLCCSSCPSSPLPLWREIFIYFWLQRQGHRNSYFIPVHCFQVTSLSAARARSGGCSDIWTATTMAGSLFPSCTGWNTIKTSRVWNRSSTVATQTGKMTSGMLFRSRASPPSCLTRLLHFEFFFFPFIHTYNLVVSVACKSLKSAWYVTRKENEERECERERNPFSF